MTCRKHSLVFYGETHPGLACCPPQLVPGVYLKGRPFDSPPGRPSTTSCRSSAGPPATLTLYANKGALADLLALADIVPRCNDAKWGLGCAVRVAESATLRCRFVLRGEDPSFCAYVLYIIIHTIRRPQVGISRSSRSSVLCSALVRGIMRNTTTECPRSCAWLAHSTMRQPRRVLARDRVMRRLQRVRTRGIASFCGAKLRPFAHTRYIQSKDRLRSLSFHDRRIVACS